MVLSTRFVLGAIGVSFLISGSPLLAQQVACTIEGGTGIANLFPGAGPDEFGWSVAVDGVWWAVGAYRHDEDATDAGQAYVYESGLLRDFFGAPAPNSPEDFFGESVAIEGNYVVVGATGRDVTGTDSGAAYVYEHSGDNWVFRAELTASDGSTVLGKAVAISDDVIVAGGLGSGEGAAYVYVRPPTGWTDMTETVKLLGSDIGAGADFGFAVDIDQDIVVVGAPSAGAILQETGKAYVFVEPPGGWASASSPLRETVILEASDGEHGDFFGWSVSISGARIAVGAPLATGFGAAYVFDEPPGGWGSAMEPINETTELVHCEAINGFNLGRSISIDGDLIVAGGHRGGPPGPGSDWGTAHVFRFCNGTWWRLVRGLTLSNGNPGSTHLFGYSVGVSGEKVIVGAPNFFNDQMGNLGGGYAQFNDFSTIPCEQDVNGDSVVDVVDLLAILGNWGNGGVGDVGCNGVVDVSDLLAVLAVFGFEC